MKHSRIVFILVFVIITVINSVKEKETTSSDSSSKAEAESQVNDVFKFNFDNDDTRREVRQHGKMPIDGLLKCKVCLGKFDETKFAKLLTCAHRCCFHCFQLYLCKEICESRVNITCPECPKAMHSSDIQRILNNPVLYDKYENFMVRRVLAADPDTRFCPAPDCSYAVIASDCAICPKIKCERPGCDSYFCYHCKAAWHPNQKCASARKERLTNIRADSTFKCLNKSRKADINSCPRCQALIVREYGCNHMKCVICSAQFCWLCLKEVIKSVHYGSLSGCPLYGKKRLSQKEKRLRTLGFLMTVTGLIIPAIIIGVPVWEAHKMYKRYRESSRLKQNCDDAGGELFADKAAGDKKGKGKLKATIGEADDRPESSNRLKEP